MSKQLVYELGDWVVFNDLAYLFPGKRGMIVGKLAKRAAKIAGTETLGIYYSYVVLLEDGQRLQAIPSVIDPAPPQDRGDLDKVVSWDTLPANVVYAIKTGKGHQDY